MTVPYALVSFDKHGEELAVPAPDGTAAVVEDLRQHPEVTDVVLMSHGWNNDPAGARRTYVAWLAEVAKLVPGTPGAPDSRVRVVGVHWPSKAWADEAPQPPAPAVLGNRTADTNEEVFASSIADTDEARKAIRTVLSLIAADQDELTAEAKTAFEALHREAETDPIEEVATLGGRSWTPEAAYDAATAAVTAANTARAGGAAVLGGGKSENKLLAMLRQLSFWTMKRRARVVGESGVATLLRDLQAAAPKARFHLVAHSFGCIVVSAALAGRPGMPSPRPVASMFLMQGAFSLWGYADSVPRLKVNGYFHSIVADKFVAGPIVTTQSRLDYAVHYFYPLGELFGSPVLGKPELPEIGAVGAYGIQGIANRITGQSMQPMSGSYAFQSGVVCNLDGTGYIRTIDGPGGAHNDVAHPEVAKAALAAMGLG